MKNTINNFLFITEKESNEDSSLHCSSEENHKIFFLISEVSQIYNISEFTIHRLIKEGKQRFYVFKNGSLCIREDELIFMLNDYNN